MNDERERQAYALLRAGVYRKVCTKRKRTLRRRGVYVWWHRLLECWVWTPHTERSFANQVKSVPFLPADMLVRHEFGEDMPVCPICGTRALHLDDLGSPVKDHRGCANSHCLYQFIEAFEEEDALTEG